MIDLERGLVSRDIFAREDIYQEEQEKLFTRAWLFVGHESLLPNPGDYFVSRMGSESVIVSRDRARQIHVLLNTCRHRGMRVCLYDQGNASSFVCPYHFWTYEEAEEFLFAEADLLDQRKFSEWLELLADDIVYFMPMRRNVKHGQHAEHENTRFGEDACTGPRSRSPASVTW